MLSYCILIVFLFIGYFRRTRLGGLTVEETTVRRAHASEARKKHGAETRLSRKSHQV
jgi:hypothetical protein